MSIATRVNAGVPTGGQFDFHTRSEPSVSLVDSAGWSTDPSLVTVIEVPVGGDRNYHMGLRSGAMQVFEFGREIDHDHADICNSISVSRHGDEVTAEIRIDGVDFTNLTDGLPADILSAKEEELGVYLFDKYGVTLDNAMEWDDSAIIAESDISGYCEPDGDTMWVTASNAADYVFEDTRVLALVRDNAEGTLMPSIRDLLLKAA